MAMLIEYSDIRISRLSVPPIIPAVQGDTGRQLVFTPTDYTIPADCTATYYVQKPSGNAVYNNATIEDGKVICDLTAQALAENGDNYGQIRIMKDEEVVTSFDFVLLVKPFRGIGAIESTTEMNIFDEAVQNAMEQIDSMLPDIVAPEFDTSTAYSTGDYVLYGGKLYRFTSDHAAGAWNASEAEEAPLGESIEANTNRITALQTTVSNLVDSTLTQAGKAADAKKTGDEIAGIKSDLSEIVPGLSNDAKAALLACFRNVVWTDAYGQSYYDDLEAALTEDKTLLYITASFNPGQNVIYTDDSLNALKQYLTVTAHYSDSTNAVVYGYTLDGTLAVGSNTITVLYNNKTTTFLVTAESREYIISDIVTFYWGWGYISKNDGRYYNVGNHTQMSADIRNIGLKAGDTISIPDYSKYSWTLTGVEKPDSSLDVIVQNSEQDYTLTASDASIAAVIVIQKQNNQDLTDQEKVYVEGNAKIIKG